MKYIVQNAFRYAYDNNKWTKKARKKCACAKYKTIHCDFEQNN